MFNNACGLLFSLLSAQNSRSGAIQSAYAKIRIVHDIKKEREREEMRERPFPLDLRAQMRGFDSLRIHGDSMDLLVGHV